MKTLHPICKSQSKIKNLFLAFCFSLVCISVETRAEVHAKIIGGDFRSLINGPVALIFFAGYECSGILVGSKEVLTAGHCVATELSNSQYEVIVGGDSHTIQARYTNSFYNPNSSAVEAAPYDLGILILSTAASGVTPVPVLYNNRVTAGERAVIYGYGANESSGTSGRNPWDNAKSGNIIFTDTGGGLLSSTYVASGSSPCHGDSGGPAIQSLGGYSAVIGTTSIGTNPVYNGNCYLGGVGAFSYVDLQSTTSRSFMANFSGIKFISGYRIYVHSMAADLSTKLLSASKTTTLTTLNSKVAAVLKEANGVVRYADGRRTTFLKSAIANIKAAQAAKKLKGKVAALKLALKNVQSINGLGVYKN